LDKLAVGAPALQVRLVFNALQQNRVSAGCALEWCPAGFNVVTDAALRALTEKRLEVIFMKDSA
jgi:hypothetical protein